MMSYLFLRDSVFLGVDVMISDVAEDIPDRMIVIGDLHGDYNTCVGALARAGVISAFSSRDPLEYHTITWLKGDNQKTHIVQIGDIFDGAIRHLEGHSRYENEEAILDLFIHLKEQAKESGGAVHLIAGNHEIMNMRFDYRYVSLQGFKNFEKYSPKDHFYCTDEVKDGYPHLCGLVGRVSAFSKDGAVREKLKKNLEAVCQIGDYIFVHAGISEEISKKYSIKQINDRFQKFIDEDGIEDEIFIGAEAITWYRGYSDGKDSDIKLKLENILDAYQANYMFIGHSVQKNGIEVHRASGERGVWLVDTGMSDAIQGEKEILEISSRVFTVLSFDEVSKNMYQSLKREAG